MHPTFHGKGLSLPAAQEPPLQRSLSVQALPSSQYPLVWVCRQDPSEQKSSVQRLPSLQSMDTETHWPIDGSHWPFRQALPETEQSADVVHGELEEETEVLEEENLKEEFWLKAEDVSG